MTLDRLVASGVRLTLRIEGNHWIVRVGDYYAGLAVEARVRTFEEAVAFAAETVRLETDLIDRTH